MKAQKEATYVEKNLETANLRLKPGIGNYITTAVLSAALAACGVFFLIRLKDPVDRWTCGLGLILLAVCILLISMVGQNEKNYRFEFVKGAGLADFKLFYKGDEIKIDYKLDKYGRFMWGDFTSRARCISYADKKSSLWFDNFTKFRIMNYLNGFLSVNDLMSKNAY